VATQGQRRKEAISAVRALRKLYRMMDTAGERVERELDRLIKRKTLIGPAELKSLMDKTNDYLKQADTVQAGTLTLYEIISALPR